MLGVLINVGSNSSCPNGRGRIFENGTFEYLPIPEEAETSEKVPTYADLGFHNVKFPNLRVHVDPEFKGFTYGHIKRGFGDVKSILKLGKEDAFFFYATLQSGSCWGSYIIGWLMGLDVYDRRNLSVEEIMGLKSCGFGNNAHLKRVDPSVDFLIKGGHGSRLLQKAFPLNEIDEPLEFKSSLKEIVLTASGKEITAGSPWFRWTMVCHNPYKLIDKIKDYSNN